MNYSLGQVRKFVVALVWLGLAALAFFVIFPDPIGGVDFQSAVVALTGAVFAAIGVFADKNATPDDWSKAVTAAQGAALSVVGYFTVVPMGTVSKITVLTGAALMVYTVWRTGNDPVPAPVERGRVRGEPIP
jgi:hypothetical protein